MIEHDADGTTLYGHVFEDKGRKITVKFKLDEPRREPALPEEPESQQEFLLERHTETQTGLSPQCEQQSQPQSESEPQPEPFPEVKRGSEESRSGPVLPAKHEPQSQPKGQTETLTEPRPQCEEQSRPQPVPSSEAQPGIEDPLQTKSQPPAQPDPLTEQLKRVAKEAKNIKSIRDRLGDSVTYLEGLLTIGDMVKDVSCPSQTRPTLTDYKYSRRSILPLAFP